MVAHAFDYSTWEAGPRGRWTSECETSLVYRGSSRIARTTWRNSQKKLNPTNQPKQWLEQTILKHYLKRKRKDFNKEIHFLLG